MYNDEVKVGVLVKEKEGRRFGGLVVESEKVNEKRTDVLVQWANGDALTYKTTFLEVIHPFPEYIQY